jgi:hypothetical protein
VWWGGRLDSQGTAAKLRRGGGFAGGGVYGFGVGKTYLLVSKWRGGDRIDFVNYLYSG